MTKNKNRKAITVRLSPELHQKLKIQLAKDNITFQELAENKIKRYLGEKPTILSKEEVINLLEITDETLAKKIGTGEINPKKVNGSYQFTLNEIIKFIVNNEWVLKNEQ